ncbi:Golgin subfamily A member 3 [Nymphon striatum]|nr:Golgin subfamily A member 3 [Nymphon striatum]
MLAMSSIQLLVEQVNHKAEDIEMNSSGAANVPTVIDNALGAVIDANTDFIKVTPDVNDGLSDIEDSIEEDRPSSTETVTESYPINDASECGSTMQKLLNNHPAVHKQHLEQHVVSRHPHTPHCDEGISDMAYPQISYPVAQYLFETNPGLTDKMERILISRSSSQKTTPTQSVDSSPSHSKSSNSSLSSLACMTDVLSLQQSVIGNVGAPAATPRQVADAICKIKSDRKIAEKNSQRAHSEAKMEQPHQTTMPVINSNGHFENKNLIQYPPDRISKIVHKPKKPWLGASPQNHSEHFSEENDRQQNSVDSSTNSLNHNPHMDASLDSGYSPSNYYNNSYFSPVNKSEKFMPNDYSSDRIETISNMSGYSERFETMSNISGISGFEEEMFRIKKLLIDAPNANKSMGIQSSVQPSAIPNNSVESVKHVNRSFEDSRKNNLRGHDVKLDTNDLLDNQENKDNFVFAIQREKANLEGQIEVMRNEMENSIEDRARMQATLASLQSQLKYQITSTQNAIQEKEMAEVELEKILKTKKDWSSRLNELQNNFEKQEIETKMFTEEMEEVETEKSKMKISVEELKMDLETRDGTIVGLKKKIAELHVGLQTMHQSNIQIQNDHSSLQNEIVALNKSKSWYQQQLRSVQEERSQIQQNLMTTQAHVTTLSNDIEKLRCETIQLKQQLLETQQRAVREKEVLMHHLESIEADMLERERTFEGLQKDRGAVEQSLADKLKKVEEDKSKMTNLTFHVSDLKNQLETAQSNLQNKEMALIKIEDDHANLIKELTLKDQVITNTKLLVQRLENQCNEANLKTKLLQQELMVKDEQLNTLKIEKTNIEVSLSSANDEKKDILEALSSLKLNLSKVETNFKQMKGEVVKKSSQLDQLQREKDRLQANLEHTEQVLTTQRQEFESQVCMDSQQRGLIFSDLKRQKNELEKVLNTLKVELRNSQIGQSKLADKNVSLEQQLQEILARWNATNAILQNVLEEKQFLEGRLETRERQSLVQGHAPDHDLYKNRAKELKEMLDSCQDEFRGKQKVYKSNIKVLMKKLRQLREKAEEEMKLRMAAEKLEIMNGDLGDADELKILNDRLTKEIVECKDKLKSTEDEVANMKLEFEKQRHIAEHNQQLAIELEREKGRLTGITQNHSALKQHTSHLEATLAQRESVVSELDYISKDVAERQRYDEAKLHEKIRGLEESLNREKNSIKEVRKQLFQDKRENSNLKRHMKSMKESLDAGSQHSDSKKMDILKLKSELDIKVQAELKHRAEIEAMHTEFKKSKVEIKNLTKALEESNARDPVLNQQMKTLTWHLRQKNEELSGMKEQLKLSEERHKYEMSAFQSSAQGVEEITEQIRMELDEVRKEKFAYQGKVTDLRAALKGSLEQNKKIIKEFKQIQKSSTCSESLPQILSLPESPTPYDDSYVNQLLEQSISIPQSRPLSNLKTCLNALKLEVGELMKQLKTEEEESPNQSSLSNNQETVQSDPSFQQTNRNSKVVTL